MLLHAWFFNRNLLFFTNQLLADQPVGGWAEAGKVFRHGQCRWYCKFFCQRKSSFENGFQYQQTADLDGGNSNSEGPPRIQKPTRTVQLPDNPLLRVLKYFDICFLIFLLNFFMTNMNTNTGSLQLLSKTWWRYLRFRAGLPQITRYNFDFCQFYQYL